MLDNFIVSKFAGQNFAEIRGQTLVALGFDSLEICQLSQFLSHIKGSTFPNYLDLKKLLLEPNTTLNTVYCIVGATTGEFLCELETADYFVHNFQLKIGHSTSMCVETPLLIFDKFVFGFELDVL